MKEIGGGLANLERKLQQQMINHRHILINGLLRAIVQYYNQHTHYPKVDDDSLAKDENVRTEMQITM
ncbi:hypothetical protein CUMW_267120 [Citrus unshiu]|uniref:Uncharacterized protein n=1 Tax=Citrus unshiu TaxID=55188 RepID=A0A2H5QW16_CITUN|nr:hypothetical protein CUMW_267120 [Citrus unshiu]